MLRSVKFNLLFYANYTYLVFQNKNIKDIEKQLNEYFANICVGLLANNLSTELTVSGNLMTQEIIGKLIQGKNFYIHEINTS